MNQRQPAHPRADSTSARTDPPAVPPAAPDDPPAVPYPSEDAELRYRSLRIPLSGRTLHLVLWLAAHDSPINGVASRSGQIWLTWKDRAISGEIRTRL